MRPRVALDGYGLEDGSRYRGIGTYLRHLVTGLSSRDDLELVVLAGRGADLPSDTSRLDIPMRLPPRWRLAERERRLPRAVTRSGADVFHSTGQVLPRHSPVAWVHTLHDLTPLYFRHALLDAERDYWLRVGPRLRSAAAVITPSRSAADQGIRYLGLDPARMHVIPHGIDPTFTPDGAVTTYDEPYLLWVSAYGAHKGLDEALEVIAGLAAAGYPHRLVIAGHVEGDVAAQIRSAIERAGCGERAVAAGRVEDIAALYRGATALVVTSRAEGFGLPALEAMACGTPVVSFDNTALSEVVGGAGILVPDGDVTATVAELRRLIDDAATARDLKAAGLSRAGEHTWDRSVDAHVAVYREVGLRA